MVLQKNIEDYRKWSDRITNTEVLQRIHEQELCLYRNIQKLKMAFAGHVLRRSSGENALLLLEGKMDDQLAQGRPRHYMWIDDINMWTNLDSDEVIKRIAQDRQIWRTYTTSCRPSTPEDGRR